MNGELLGFGAFLALFTLAAVVVTCWDRRRALWSVLRGRPTAYRVTIDSGTLTFDADRRGLAQECVIRGTEVGIRINHVPPVGGAS